MKASVAGPRLRELVLPAGLADHLAAGHPWVYRDHVPRGFEAPSGTWLRIRSGNWVGVALWDDESQVALRVFSRGRAVDSAFVEDRVRAAFELRQPLRALDVTGYRLVYGEADGLPGVVVDSYDGYLVIVTYSKSLGVLLPNLVSALERVASPRGIVRRHGAGEVQLLFGKEPPRDLVVREHNGAKLLVDVRSGQKTGLFLDHRENRKWVGDHALGKSVLNLFSYTGGFSIAAALGGASAVTSVDAAAPASAACEENFRLNGLASFPHECVTADVFEYLEQANAQKRRFDFVICDPPSFAKSRAQLHQAEKAYRRLTALGLAATEPGGLYAAASCTSQVGPEAFRHVIAEACRKARVRFQILHDIGQPIDHPVLAAHPEGRYLKFIVGRVIPQD